MKVIDYHEAIFASELTSNAKLTALAISKYYNWKEDKACWPSNKTLAKATSLSIRSIVRAKNELVNNGYLVSQRRMNNSSVYKATTPGHTVSYPVTKWPTNNEVNNEVNNEEGSKEPLIFNNNSLEEVTIITDDSSALIEVPSVHYKEMTAAASRIINEDWLSW